MTISRRRFLAATSAAVAPVLVPASALGRDGQTPPSERIELAIVGCGGQGRRNMTRLHRAGCEIVATCDVDSAHLDDAARDADKIDQRPARFADHRNLLADHDCDAVCISTPDHWHAPIAVRAAAAGKDLYVEKPLANTVGGSRAIADAVAEHGVVCQVGSHERSGGDVRRAAELVRSGRIGTLKAMVVNLPTEQNHHLDVKLTRETVLGEPPATLDFDAWCGPTQPLPYSPQRCHFHWRFVLRYGGGEMTDRGAHVIDIGHLIAGIDGAEPSQAGPTRIAAQGVRPVAGPYDTFMDYRFEAEYPGGVVMRGASSGDRGIKMVGTDGWIFVHVHGGRLEASDPAILAGDPSGELGRVASHHASFVEAVRMRTEPTAPVLAGHRTAVVCHLMNIAMRLGRELQWDPAAERFVDDDEANALLAAPGRQPYAA